MFSVFDSAVTMMNGISASEGLERIFCKGKAGHRLHVPVGNDQTVAAPAQFGERSRSVIGIVNLLKTKLLLASYA
jgi:hypothetical protein